MRIVILNLNSRDPNRMIYAVSKETEVFKVKELQAKTYNLKDSLDKYVKEFVT